MSNRYEIITSNIINAASAPADLGIAVTKATIPGVPVQPGKEDWFEASVNLFKGAAAILELCKKVPGISTIAAVTSLGNNVRKASLEMNGVNRRISAETQWDLVSDFSGIAAAVAVASIGATSTAPVWVSAGILLATAGIASSIYSATLGVENKQREVDLVNSAANTVATLNKFPEFQWFNSDIEKVEELRNSSALVYPAVQLLHYLSPSLTLAEAQSIINASGSGALLSGGKLGELAATLNGIRRMIGLSPVTIADDESYLPALEQTFAATTSQLGSVKLLAWPQTADVIEILARSNASVRASMVAGLPFMVMQGSVAGVDAAQSSLIDYATGQGQLSEQWLRDRALYLSLQSKANSVNRPIGPDGVMVIKGETKENLEFIDATTGNKLTAPIGEGIVGALNRISFGTNNGDSIRGRSDADRLYGGAGNDTITAGKGNDYIEGNAGDDVLLSGEEGNDIIFGGEGNDRIEGGQNNDILMGGAGIDTLDGGEGSDFLNGGSGKDTLTGGSGNDYLYDQGGTGSSEQSTLKGDSGNDILEVKGGAAGITILGGGADNDIILGNSTGSNSLDGDSGNDIITGGDQYDIINGGDGADNIEAGGGADRIDGGKGSDYIRGGEGFDDYIYNTADFGTDLIEDSTGSIAGITGGSFDINRQAYLGGGYEYRKYTMGHITLLGINRQGDTKNTIYLKDWQAGQFGISLSGQEEDPEKPQSSPISVESQAGNEVDFILGKDASDGGKGNDFLQGTAAQSVLTGGIGNDVLNGMAGDDWLEGGEGNDYISTGQGADVAYGGAGHDVLTAYGTLSTDVCARQPIDLLTTQRFYYKIAGSEERIYIEHPRLAVFDFEIRQKPTTDTSSASGELVFRNVGLPSPSLEAGTVLSLILGDTQGIERGESVALNELPNAELGKPISYQFRLESNSALQATGQKGVRLWGGTGNDILYGAGDSDKLYGQADNDVLVGFGGDDALYGGAGKDELSGGDGRDFLDGGDDESADTLYGGMGADVIYGGGGDDKIVGDLPYLKGANGYPPGTDTKLMGGDYLSGGAGKDKIWGDAGDDYLDGGAGDDQMYGGLDDDHLFGGGDADDLSGGKGNDYLDGGAGKDNLFELDADGEGAAEQSVLSGVELLITINSIAIRADSMPAKCSKGFKNRGKNGLQRCRHREYKRNRQIAGIEPARSAIESVVSNESSYGEISETLKTSLNQNNFTS